MTAVFGQIPAEAASGTGIYVSSTTGSDTNDGTTWQTAYATIAKALSEASGTSEVYNVYIAEGAYDFTEMYALPANTWITIIGGYEVPTATSDTEADACNVPSGGDNTTVTVGLTTGLEYDAMFYVANASTSSDTGGIYLKNLKISNLGAAGTAAVMRSPLAYFDVDSDYNSFYLDYIEIDGYYSTATNAYGGGVVSFRDSSNATVSITNSEIHGGVEKSAGVGGGFLYIWGDNLVNIDVVIDHSNFYDNHSAGTGGATSLLTHYSDYDVDGGQSSIEITDSEFCNNSHGWATGQSAGVMYVEDVSEINLERNYFTSHEGGYGGVGYFNGVGKLTSFRNTYYRNTAYDEGGVFYVDGDASAAGYSNEVSFQNDIFYGNASRDGGGVISVETDHTVTVTNCQFTANGYNADVYDDGTSVTDITSTRGGTIYMESVGTLSIHTDSTLLPALQPNKTTFCGGTAQYGGAIFQGGTASVTIDGGTLFSGNTASVSGGAIFMEENGSAILNISGDNLFTGNTATSAEGGAIYAYSDSQTVSIEGATFSNNTAGTNGGAIITSTNLTLEDNAFTSNTASGDGGAIYHLSVGAAREVTSSNNEYVSNTATGDGGAICFFHQARASTLTSTGDKFISNTSSVDSDNNGGGAIGINGSGAANVTIADDYFYQNSAVRGGAVSLYVNAGGTVNFTGSEFLENNATTLGGALAVFDLVLGTEVDLIDSCKFYGNTLAGDATNTDWSGRSEIWLEHGLFNYFANIVTISNSEMQFEVNDTNYPSGGYNDISTGNTQSTGLTAPTTSNTTAVSSDCPDEPAEVCGADTLIFPPSASISTTNDSGESVANAESCSGATKTFTLSSASGTAPFTFVYSIVVTAADGTVTTTTGQTATTASGESSIDVDVSVSGDVGATYEIIVTSVTDSTTVINDDGTTTDGVTTDYTGTCADEIKVTYTIIACIECTSTVVATTGTDLETPVGISTLDRDTESTWVEPNAFIQLESVTYGFVPTRMTTTQRDALTAQEGMVIWNTTTACLEFYNGTDWVCSSNNRCSQ